MSSSRNLIAATVLASLAVSGCATKSDNADNGSVDGIKLGPGMTDSTVTLGVITDLSGPFAVLGMPALDGLKLAIDQINEEGGICGRFAVELDVQDSGSDVQKATQAYDSIEEDVLALVQTLGAPVNTALIPRFAQDQVVNVPLAWGRSLLGWEGNAVPGGFYDTDMANGLSYLLQEGLLEKGDAVGHIYFTGEYGENGLAGAEHVAEANGLTVIGAEVSPTDVDMTAHVKRFAEKGVDAIALSVAPNQTASAVSVAASEGLTLPVVMNNPAFSPGLLDSPVGETLLANGYIANAFSPSFTDTAEDLAAAWKQAHPDKAPTSTVVAGAGTGEIIRHVLDKACTDGDMTREGLLSAKTSLDKLTTQDIVVPLDLSGGATTRSSNIQRPADVPGGMKIVAGSYTGPDTDSLK
jgi:ABC-type branched-subunit amino acid transport system substrate-binding protein